MINKKHIYFFIVGALFFYLLLYRTQVIPRFISVWGILASIVLFIVTIIKLFGVKSSVLDVVILLFLDVTDKDSLTKKR